MVVLLSPLLFSRPTRESDGRKVLRSSIREFLCSEAMAALGIPTTRAASLVTSDLYVNRDPLNNGRRRPERCSVVLRIAPSFIRWTVIGGSPLPLTYNICINGLLSLSPFLQDDHSRKVNGWIYTIFLSLVKFSVVERVIYWIWWLGHIILLW